MLLSFLCVKHPILPALDGQEAPKDESISTDGALMPPR
jgi:hypothetical protein